MLNKNQRFGFAIAVLISFGLMLSTLAMTPNQATATSTIEATITGADTPTSTSTPTTTPTSTPLPSATATYSIPEPLQTEIANINEKLDDLQQNPFSTHGASIFDNLLASAIWIGLVALVKKVLKIKNNQDSSDGKQPNRTLVILEDISDGIFKFSLWITIGLVFIWLVYYLGQSISQSSNNAELVAISRKLEEIQNEIKPMSAIATSTVTPTASLSAIQPTSSQQAESADSNSKSGDTFSFLLVIETMGIGLVAFFAYFSSKLTRYQTEIHAEKFPKSDFRKLDASLLPAVLIALVILILPAPVDGILMPLLIPFLIFSFFDLIRMYPSIYLKNLAVVHYSKIIYLAQFGAWYSFFNILKNYASPFFILYSNAWINVVEKMTTDATYQSEYLISQATQLIWGVAPLLFAMILAVKPWRRIKMQIEKNQLVRIKKSLTQHNKNSASGT